MREQVGFAKASSYTCTRPLPNFRTAANCQTFER